MKANQSMSVNEKNQYIFGSQLEDYTSDDEDLDEVYKNQYEMMQPINKRRIFQLIDSFDDSNIAGKWDQRTDDETLKIWSKLKGSELTKEHYIIKT